MTNNKPVVNPPRQFPKRYSPLAQFMVALGHYYDPSTGLVKQNKPQN